MKYKEYEKQSLMYFAKIYGLLCIYIGERDNLTKEEIRSMIMSNNYRGDMYINKQQLRRRLKDEINKTKEN